MRDSMQAQSRRCEHDHDVAAGTMMISLKPLDTCVDVGQRCHSCLKLCHGLSFASFPCQSLMEAQLRVLVFCCVRLVVAQDVLEAMRLVQQR